MGKITKQTVIGLLILILASSLSWAGNVVFPDYPTRVLKVLEVDEELQTVVLESPDGVTAALSVGDVVGQEHATIIEIKKFIIILEKNQDKTGRKKTIGIPVIQIKIFR